MGVSRGLPALINARAQAEPPDDALRSVGAAFGRTRLRTLVSLRWMAICGQTAAVLFVRYGLGFELPIVACLAAIGASAWLNVALMAIFPSQRLSPQAETAAQLAFDIVQLSVLMILAPVTVGASRLLPAYAGLLSLLALICCVAMSMWGLPLPWRPGEMLQLPLLYQGGQLAAVATGLAFFAVSSWRTGRDEARLVSALDAVQAVLSREQQLSALGALAAATAHELGTPLATIHLAAKELLRSVKPGHAAREDVELIVEQAERCRAILKQISQRRQASDAAMSRASLPLLIEESAEPHRSTGRMIRCVCSPLTSAGEGQEKPPIVLRRPEIIHALGAFIENAASFAESEVSVNARWSESEVRIYITDDGPGFAASVLTKLGEPYFSERTVEQRGGGLGLGFFIACTLLERTGASVTPYNRQSPARGAVVRIVWPREAIEAPEGWNEE
jgi:two-component system sensor histidine kinase RegB